jgi:cytidylate kinase
MTLTSDSVVAALAHLHQYTEKRTEPKQVPPITIAISRQAGSRGADIARAVGARLGWPVYDHELLSRIAAEKGLNERLLHSFDERCPHWLQDILDGFSTEYRPTEHTYLKQLVKLVASLGEVGHCVIVGRGAGHVLPAETTLRVRVVAPRAMRVAKTEKWLGVQRAEAERWVDRTDAERTRFIVEHFNKNPDDALLYDVILNSGRYSLEECTDLIVQAAKYLESHVKAVHTPRQAG